MNDNAFSKPFEVQPRQARQQEPEQERPQQERPQRERPQQERPQRERPQQERLQQEPRPGEPRLQEPQPQKPRQQERPRQAPHPNSSRSKGDDICDRLIDLAAGVLMLLPALARRPGAACISAQLERAAPAGGANYEEARGAESVADFVQKVRIALKEVRETRFWLRLAVRARMLPSSGEPLRLIDEATELIAILTASANTARRRARSAHS